MAEPIYPRNQFTELIERASAANARGERSGAIESLVSAQSAPTVRSSAFGPMAPEVEPLSPEERAELDAKAQALGIMESDKPTGPYESLEDAIAASAPVEQSRTTAREFVNRGGPHGAPQPANFGAGPRLPDFSRVQGIDLNLNVVYVDGMAFPIPEEDVREFRVYAMETAKLSIMKQFETALNMLQSIGTGERKDGEDTAEVHPVREPERDSSGSEGGQPGVRTVPPLEQMDLFSSGDGPEDTPRTDPA